jgi:hypothetical protein
VMRQLCFRSLSQILSNDQNPILEPIASWVPTSEDLTQYTNLIIMA